MSLSANLATNPATRSPAADLPADLLAEHGDDPDAGTARMARWDRTLNGIRPGIPGADTVTRLLPDPAHGRRSRRRYRSPALEAARRTD